VGRDDCRDIHSLQRGHQRSAQAAVEYPTDGARRLGTMIGGIVGNALEGGCQRGGTVVRIEVRTREPERRICRRIDQLGSEAATMRRFGDGKRRRKKASPCGAVQYGNRAPCRREMLRFLTICNLDQPSSPVAAVCAWACS
jgi:hypothetical protein